MNETYTANHSVLENSDNQTYLETTINWQRAGAACVISGVCSSKVAYTENQYVADFRHSNQEIHKVIVFPKLKDGKIYK